MSSRKIFYADMATIAVLKDSRSKVLLPGSNTGYFNFGDILQNKGAISFYLKQTMFVPVLVFDIKAITDPTYVEDMKQKFSVEAIIFFSDVNYSFSDFMLSHVSEVRNIDLLHLYGGGFLNSMWGRGILDIVESLLQNFRVPNYIVSGQQVNEDFAKEFTDHINTFRPKLIGVRDLESKKFLKKYGVDPEFSFDDAYEELEFISRKIPTEKRDVCFGHINISDYTNGKKSLDEIVRLFSLVKDSFDFELTLFNGFNDKRFHVIDSLSAVIKLENQFPYKKYTVVDGVRLSFGGLEGIQPLAAKIGISSSYHASMLMHICGTPCWLVSNNDFYDQKKSALGLSGTFEEFIKNPTVPSFESKISARKQWEGNLKKTLSNLEVLPRDVIKVDEGSLVKGKDFEYKSDEVASINEVNWHKKNSEKYWDEARHFEYLLAVSKEDTFFAKFYRSVKKILTLKS